jgi:hypothetical protein
VEREQAEAGLAVDAAGVGRGSGQCLGDVWTAQEARGRERASKVRLKWTGGAEEHETGGTGVTGDETLLAKAGQGVSESLPSSCPNAPAWRPHPSGNGKP